MEFGFDFCWGFDPLAIHSHRNGMEQKIRKNQITLLPREAEGTSCCPERNEKKVS
jgi:hypothetical protein